MIKNILYKLYNTFYLSKLEKRLYKKLFRKKNPKKNAELILIQCTEDIFYFSLFGSIINKLSEKNSLIVHQYVQRSLTLGTTSNISSFLKSIILNNRFRDNKWIKLHSSYVDNIAYRYEGSSNIFSDIKAFFKAHKIFKQLTSKENLINLVIEDIKVGDLIYDSYLRFKPAPTVDIDDFYLCIVIWQTIRNIKITRRYFQKNRPLILLNSYSTYIQHGITVRIALQFGTKVYTFGNFQTFGKQLSINDFYQTANPDNYNDTFNKFIDKEKKLNIAKEALENKLSGTIDVSTAYMKTSAYKSTSKKIPYVKDYIIVFLHDFYDAPHGYNGMVFPDFLEWIEFTIKVLDKYNIPYYLKPHPNQISDSEEVVKRLTLKYPSIKLLSSKITNKQLVNAGIKLGVSVNGTVAHELVYMGVPVLLCGTNPHSSYNFTYEANTKDEYNELLKNYDKLSLVKGYKEEVESFFYMHNLNKNNYEKELLSSFVKLFLYSNRNDKEIEFLRYKDILDSITSNREFEKFIEGLI